jgi:(p)ppGpp synthase/HD superfamily hydrolase
MKLLIKAVAFASKHHKRQRRKYSDEAYINHPVRVMQNLSQYTDDEEVLCASVLHDTIEDCDVTYEMILERFGDVVANLVLEVTNDPKERKKFKTKSDHLCHKLSKMSYYALLIKLCDRMDNVFDLIKLRDFDDTFFEYYIEQTNNMMETIINTEFCTDDIVKTLVDEVNKRVEANVILIQD